MKLIDLINKIKNTILFNSQNHKELAYIKNNYKNEYKSSKVNLGQIQSQINLEKHDVSVLSDLEFQVFSQFGDDGIINWLTNKLPIKNRTFIEFGVEDYQEANTRFLLVNDYWSGLVIDGSKKNIDSILKEQLYNFFDLDAICNFITTENINQIIRSAKFSEEIGLLSIDVDGNDYWIWKAINSVKPIIVISEYNCLFGYEKPYTVEYDASFVRGTKYKFNYYGASLKSLCDLGSERGYGFIGCNSAGNNAYFIRKDYLQFIDLPILSAVEGYRFASFSEVWKSNGEAMRGAEKVKSLNGLPVYNTKNGQVENISSDEIVKSLIEANKLNRL